MHIRRFHFVFLFIHILRTARLTCALFIYIPFWFTFVCVCVYLLLFRPRDQIDGLIASRGCVFVLCSIVIMVLSCVSWFELYFAARLDCRRCYCAPRWKIIRLDAPKTIGLFNLCAWEYSSGVYKYICSLWLVLNYFALSALLPVLCFCARPLIAFSTAL